MAEERAYVEARTAALLTQRRAEMEWFIAWGRITFTLAIFLRTVSIGSFAWWKLHNVAVPLAISVWVLWRVKRKVFGEWDVVAVVISDALIGALALGGNIFEEHTHGYVYLGLYRMPDVAIVVFLVALAALRFSERGVLASGLANAVLGLGLAWLDGRHHGLKLLYGSDEISMHLIVVAATTGLGIFAASRLRRMLTEHALTLVREERTRTNLDEVLRDSHDIRASLQAALIDATLLVRNAPDVPQGKTIALNLQNVADHLLRIRRWSADEARAASETQVASVADVLEESIRAMRVAFPEKHIERVGPKETVHVIVVAGARGLRRIADNLLRNACEGDGTKAASAITIRVAHEADDKDVTISFEDDGPGFVRDARIAIERGRIFTTKPGGGAGLAIVRRTVEESGGAFEVEDAREGARLRVTLRRA